MSGSTSIPPIGGGIFPDGITASPTQQMSVADQLAAIGIPLGDEAHAGGSGVTPPQTFQAPQLPAQGGGSSSSSGSNILGTIGQVAGIVGAVAAL